MSSGRLLQVQTQHQRLMLLLLFCGVLRSKSLFLCRSYLLHSVYFTLVPSKLYIVSWPQGPHWAGLATPNLWLDAAAQVREVWNFGSEMIIPLERRIFNLSLQSLVPRQSLLLCRSSYHFNWVWEVSPPMQVITGGKSCVQQQNIIIRPKFDHCLNLSI